ETGFIAVLWCPWTSLRPALRLWPSGDSPSPSPVPLWLYRWLIFRIMLGAGLIKLRGDPCWTELSCLDHHFETQPIPGPLSPWFHALPRPLLAAGVVFNHVAELLVPFMVFGPRRLRLIAGVTIVLFQLTLILSGNLAFLNWLTIVPAIACFDDDFLRHLLPPRLQAHLGLDRGPPPEQPPTPRIMRWANYAFAALVLWLSLPVVANLIGRDQAMNRSYDRLHLVNTYGAFGSIGTRRLELIIEGSAAESPAAGDDDWVAYEFRCKPGAVDRRPCWITPYHLRLDWLAWFAALEVEHGGGLQREDWMLHLVYKLLQGDPGARRLLGNDPFPDAPPRWIRIVVYEYHLAPPSLPWSDAPVWQRERLGELLPPIRGDDERLLTHLRARGWFSP
ncbi:MAG: lipase maturation factor family protein, partial [Myxococcales bacterium]|nr:lipase maturation factor family protein [Myxococcales bacterium]